MQNSQLWVPTKFVLIDETLRASRDSGFVDASSWLATELTAGFYQSAIADHASGDLLDLGCGTAPLYEAYRDFVETVTCVDWQHSHHGSQYVDVFVDLNRPLPIGDRSFDTVILSDVLEHILNPEQLLSEVCRMLRPGGKLLMNVPFLYPLHETPHDYFRYTEFALLALAARAGLEIVEVKPLGGRVAVLSDLMAKALRRFRLLSGVTRLHQQYALRKSLKDQGAHSGSDRTESTPLGYSMIARRD